MLLEHIAGRVHDRIGPCGLFLVGDDKAFPGVRAGSQMKFGPSTQCAGQSQQQGTGRKSAADEHSLHQIPQ